MLNKIKNKLHYLIPPLIVLAIFTIILIMNGCYPFGKNIVAGYDYDLGYIPVYYKLYDFLHGTSSAFYDFNLGAGANSYGSLVSNALFSPISWLIYFSSRAGIPYFLTLIFLLKLMLISVTSYFAFNRLFPKAPRFYKMAFSVMYAISGYILVTWSQFIWFESIALFPLVVVGLKEIFDKKKSLLFVISLTLSLIFSYYISYMILFFMLLATLLGLIFYDTDNKKVITTKILIYILVSLMISMFAFLPSFMQSMSSYRMGSEYTIEYFNPITMKLAYVIPYGILFILFIKKLFTYKENKKSFWFYLLLFVFTSIGLFIEPINKWWHTGSYSGMPFRYGFIPIFVLMLGSLSYLSTHKLKPILKKVTDKQGLLCYIFVALIIGLVVFVSRDTLLETMTVSDITTKKFLILLLIEILIIVSICIALSLCKKMSLKLLTISLVSEILIYAYASNFGAPNSYIYKMDDFKFPQNQSVYRYKDETRRMRYNFPYQLNIPSVSNWLHIIPESQYKSQLLFGYENTGMAQLSKGGTYFSDLIYGNKYTVSEEILPEELYILLKREGNKYYYESKYNLSFVIPYSSDNMNEYEDKTFDYQNRVYKSLFNKEDNIIDVEKDYDSVSKNDDLYVTEYNLDINSQSILYFYDYAKQNNVVEIYVNDHLVSNSSTMERNFWYGISRTTINLGVFKDEFVNVKIYTKDKPKNLEIGIMQLDKIISISNEYNRDVGININKNEMTINYNNKNNDNKILIPVNYNNGFSIYNNDKLIDYETNLNNFISVKLNSGENKIKLVFEPPYLFLGIKLSIISLITFILFSIINKKIKLENMKIIKNLFFILFIIIEVLFIGKIYLLSMF